jgi:hypothetical protein
MIVEPVRLYEFVHKQRVISRALCGMPVPLRELDRWRRSVPIREPPGHDGTMDDCEHQAPPYGHRSSTASPLAVSFQTPELGLQADWSTV